MAPPHTVKPSSSSLLFITELATIPNNSYRANWPIGASICLSSNPALD